MRRMSRPAYLPLTLLSTADLDLPQLEAADVERQRPAVRGIELVADLALLDEVVAGDAAGRAAEAGPHRSRSDIRESSTGELVADVVREAHGAPLSRPRSQTNSPGDRNNCD
jgi:hypothetical protein